MAWKVDLASTIVEIESDEGIVGRGEATMSNGAHNEEVLARAIKTVFAPMIIGEDPRDITALWRKMWLYARTMGFLSPVSAIDQALWDLKARWLGVPIYDLLGGKVRDKIRVYACSAVKKDIDQHVADIRKYVELGFQATKLSIGRGVDEDIELIRRATEAAEGKIKIAVDANGYYDDFAAALRIAEVCDECGIFWLEEPLPLTDITGLAELNRRVKTPISGFQSETSAYRMKEYLRNNALEIYQPRLDYCGGITQSKRIAEICEVWHKLFIPHSFGGGVKFAGTVQVIAAALAGGWVEFPVVLDHENPKRFMTGDYISNSEVFRVDDEGFLTVPTGIGNGIEINEDAIRELEIDY